MIDSIPETSHGPTDPAIDHRRYRKVRRFLARVLLQAFVHDLLLNRRGLRALRKDPLPRWIAVAQRYRALALELGGVLIKTGQFLSTRVDLLPPEIISELAGLQDRVPPDPFAEIVQRVERSFGKPLSEVFPHFGEEPLGAASLAQVHEARLTDGEEVVVKVLRPRIEVLVETDLSALAFGVRWLKWSKRIQRRVDLDRLREEIEQTTRAELDFAAEGRNVERFGEMFEEDPSIAVPRVIWPTSTSDVLTLEKVGGLKVNDPEGLRAVGIDPTAVAQKLFRCYLDQVFVHHFVHADPHPGNLFVRPLTEAASEPIDGDGDGDENEDGATAFEIIFVDFGMMATIPERLQDALREYLLALTTQDARRMVRSYQAFEVLLPGADLERLVALHQDLFDRMWGVKAGDMRDKALNLAAFFFRRYRSLLYEMPFQVQVDLLFVTRALGLLAGVTTRLDPDFDYWNAATPFAEDLMRKEFFSGLRSTAQGLTRNLRAATELPERMERFLDRSEVLFEKRKPKLDQRLPWAVLAGSSLIAGAVARLGDDPAAVWLFIVAGGTFLLSLRRPR